MFFLSNNSLPNSCVLWTMKIFLQNSQNNTTILRTIATTSSFFHEIKFWFHSVDFRQSGGTTHFRGVPARDFMFHLSRESGCSIAPVGAKLEC